MWSSAPTSFTLLQPLQGRLPQTGQEFANMCTQLRRYGHIAEAAPGNLAQLLRGQFRQARPGAYLTQQQGLQEAAQLSAQQNEGGTMSTYFGTMQSNRSNAGPFWDSLVPQPMLSETSQEAYPTWSPGVFSGSRQAEAAQYEWESWEPSGSRLAEGGSDGTWFEQSYPTFNED